MGSFRFLFRSLVFLSLLLGAGTIFYSFLGRIIQTNPALNGFILAIFGFGVCFLLTKLFILARQTRWLVLFRSDNLDRSSMSGILEKSPLLSPFFEALESGKSLMLPQGGGIVERAEVRLDAAREISRYLMALLIFLGLLGTFWGLSQTVSSLSDVIAGLNTSQTEIPSFFETLKTSLSQPLVGMGVAFSTSFFGLSASLILGFLDLQLGCASRYFLVQLEGACGETLQALAPTGAKGTDVAYLKAFWKTLGERTEKVYKSVDQHHKTQQAIHQSLMDLTEKLANLCDQMRTQQPLMLKMAEGQTHLQHSLKDLLQTVGTQGITLDESTRSHLRRIDVVCTNLLENGKVQHEALLGDLKQEIRLLAQTVSYVANAEAL